jgi:uncharacterized Zn-finger protein
MPRRTNNTIDSPNKIYEVRRYDGKGNLIETISPKELEKRYWKEFGKIKEIPEAKLADMNNTGMFHLIMPLASNHAEKHCLYCGEKFVPPRHRPEAKYCTKPNVKDSEQCRRIHYRERHLKPQSKKTCEYCGTAFLTKRVWQRFCDDEGCNNHAFERRERQEKDNNDK